MSEKPLILAVDDEPANLKLICAALDKDFSLALAKSAAMAEQFLSRKKPSLILLDIKMPEKDGITFANELMAGDKNFDIPIVFVTGLEDSETRLKAQDMGAAGFVEKPFVPSELNRYIQELFSNGI